MSGAEPVPAERVEHKPKDQSAQVGKQADEAKEESSKSSVKEEPGKDSQDQRVISFSEVKRKEAEKDPEKKVSEGQVEIS